MGRLYNGPLRFSQLRKSLAPLSERMLILALKKLETIGLVERSHAGDLLVHNTYQLTALGRSLLENMGDLFLWMTDHAAAIIEAYQESAETADPVLVKQA